MDTYFTLKVRNGCAVVPVAQQLLLALSVTLCQQGTPVPLWPVINLVSSCSHVLAMETHFLSPALQHLSPWVLLLLRSQFKCNCLGEASLKHPKVHCQGNCLSVSFVALHQTL